MRTMKNQKTGQELQVIKHIILKNFWEYYIIAADTNDTENQVYLCLVLGEETELGDVYLPEIKPYLASITSNLSEVMPAPGWAWAA